MGTTKSRGQKSKFDKFYTKREVALQCIQEINLKEYDLIIEPSAGNGAFSSQISSCLSYDIEPENEEIIQSDFFSLSFDPGNILVIGNPPFGVQNKLALEFINHAAQFARTIAFILPLSFKKSSVYGRINEYFHLSHERELSLNSFLLEGREYSVPTVFQIWEKQLFPRGRIKLKTITPYFEFVDAAHADCSIRRVGGNAGKASLDLSFSKQSNYFIKIKDGKEPREFVDFINSLVFPSISWAVGPKSLSKGELILVYEEALK